MEKVLGSLQDLAPQIRELIERYPVSVPDIAGEADVAVPTIYNILKGKVNTEGKGHESPSRDRRQD